ncbi:MAG: DUF4351 domain-containing protein [Blastocatellia bacterium]|nr:DUF4351 domain-containing protein [Blastocatellia bacterium]
MRIVRISERDEIYTSIVVKSSLVFLKQESSSIFYKSPAIPKWYKKLELDGLESLAEAIFDFSSVDDLLSLFKR